MEERIAQMFYIRDLDKGFVAQNAHTAIHEKKY